MSRRSLAAVPALSALAAGATCLLATPTHGHDAPEPQLAAPSGSLPHHADKAPFAAVQRWWQPGSWAAAGDALLQRQPSHSGSASSAPLLAAALLDAAASLAGLVREAHADSAAPRVTAAHGGSSTPLPLATAYRASLLQPLLAFMREPAAAAAAAAGPAAAAAAAGALDPSLEALPPAPSAAALAALEAAALAHWDGPQPLQVVTLVWALAWAGHSPSPAYLQRLQAAVSAGCMAGDGSGSSGGGGGGMGSFFGSSPAAGAAAPLPAPHRAVLLWAAAMHGATPPPVWEAGLRSLAAAAPSTATAVDDVTVMYLLHAAMLVAADTSGRAVGGGSSSSGSSSSVRVAPTSPTSASASSPACQPRATREEVVAAVAGPLGRSGRSLQARVAQAYAEYVPLHAAISGPYLALLFVLQQLAAAEAEAPGGRGGGAGGLDWAPPGGPQAAAALLANPKELARCRRDLLFHWRGDALVDEVQRARNQIVYLLTRRLGVTVSQPDDVDVAVPSRWLALYVVRRGSSSGSSTSTSSSSSNSSRGGGSGGGAEEVEAEAGAAGEALELLLRERFAPPVGAPPPPPLVAAGSGAAVAASGSGMDGLEGGAAAGAWAARLRQLRRLGWRVAVVDAGVWSGLQGDAAREAFLHRLLRGQQ